MIDGDAWSDQNQTSDEKQYTILIVTKPISISKIIAKIIRLRVK